MKKENKFCPYVLFKRTELLPTLLLALSTIRFNFGLITSPEWGGVKGTQSHPLVALLSPGHCKVNQLDTVQDLVS
jgi:hypothetical protein